MFCMSCGVPSGYKFGEEGPTIPVNYVEFDQPQLFLLTPLLFVDALLQVVVVPFSALLAVSTLDSVLFFHYPRNLAPPLYSTLFVELL